MSEYGYNKALCAGVQQREDDRIIGDQDPANLTDPADSTAATR